MVTPVDEERPRSSGLSSNTVLDALNDNDDSDYQDTDSDSDVVECADEEELRTTLGQAMNHHSRVVQLVQGVF